MKKIILINLLLILAVWGKAFSENISQDTGMVLQISGTVMYSEKKAQAGLKPVQAFMKVRQGDMIHLKDNALMNLIYIANGRRETWKGPAVVEIGESQSLPGENASAVQVENVPVLVTENIGQSLLPIPQTNIRHQGAVTVRGVSEDLHRGLKYSASEEKKKNEIDKALTIYNKMKKESEKNDVMPNLFLLSVLSRYEEFGMMKKLIDEMISVNPDNAVFIHWKNWIEENYPVRMEIFCLIPEKNQVYKEIGPFSLSETRGFRPRAGDMLTFSFTNTSVQDIYCYLVRPDTQGKPNIIFPLGADSFHAFVRKEAVFHSNIALTLEKAGQEESIFFFASPKPLETYLLSDRDIRRKMTEKKYSDVKWMQLKIMAE